MPLVVPAAGEALMIVARAIAGGDLAVIPTDTVYGLAARAGGESVRRLFAAKGRPETRPIPVLLASSADVRHLVAAWPRAARLLARHFWPGALTLVVAARPDVPVEITAETGTVGVRVPASAVARQIIALAGGYLAVTSANRSGEPPATTLAEALASLGEHVPWFVDGGVLRDGVPSTVVLVAGDRVIVKRRGAITREAIGLALAGEIDPSQVEDEAN